LVVYVCMCVNVYDWMIMQYPRTDVMVYVQGGYCLGVGIWKIIKSEDFGRSLFYTYTHTQIAHANRVYVG
jgi:hypothetical protein